jgi:cleavage stimulation factor subunit 2
MVKMNAVNVDVLQVRLFFYAPLTSILFSGIQKTVAAFSAPPAAPAPAPGPVPPISALPPHLAIPNQNQHQYPTPTPQPMPPPYPPLNNVHNPTMNPYGNGIPPPNPGYNNPNPNPYGYPMPSAGGGGGGGGVGISEALASIPDDQKAMIMRVISMTPEQIALLPPQERASVLQLVGIFIFDESYVRYADEFYVPCHNFIFN